MESTIGKNIEAIDTFEVNSVDTAPIKIIINKFNSFFEDMKFLRLSPISTDNPEFFWKIVESLIEVFIW